MTETKPTPSSRKADEKPDEQPSAKARADADHKTVEETNKAATTGTGHSTEGKSSKPKERSAERGYIDHGDNPADEGFYDTPPGARVNEGYTDNIPEDGK